VAKWLRPSLLPHYAAILVLHRKAIPVLRCSAVLVLYRKAIPVLYRKAILVLYRKAILVLYRSTFPVLYRSTFPVLYRSTFPVLHRSTFPDLHRSTFPDLRRSDGLGPGKNTWVRRRRRYAARLDLAGRRRSRSAQCSVTRKHPASGHRHAEQAGGPDDDQFGGCSHHEPSFLRPLLGSRACLVRCNYPFSGRLADMENRMRDSSSAHP
jgi:hypothetical protein